MISIDMPRLPFWELEISPALVGSKAYARLNSSEGRGTNGNTAQGTRQIGVHARRSWMTLSLASRPSASTAAKAIPTELLLLGHPSVLGS